MVDAKEFDEFCRFDCVTVLNGGKYYRIPRRPHGLIEMARRQVHAHLLKLKAEGKVSGGGAKTSWTIS